MASENAKQVAKKVSENLRKGKRVNLGKIIKETGYSKSTSESPTVVTETKSYQEEIKPILDLMVKERQRLINEMSGRELTKVQYESLTRALDLLTKNIQLLSDRPTENVKRLLTDEQIDELLLIRSRQKDNSSGQK